MCGNEKNEQCRDEKGSNCISTAFSACSNYSRFEAEARKTGLLARPEERVENGGRCTRAGRERAEG